MSPMIKKINKEDAQLSDKVLLAPLVVVGALGFCKTFCLVLAIVFRAEHLESFQYSWLWVPAIGFLFLLRTPEILDFWERLLGKN